MSANIPNDPVAIQRFFTSRDNNANSATYVGQEQRLWYDPVTNAIYVSDGNTAGGILVGTGGGGNGVPGGPTNSIQYNAGGGNFGGSSNLTISGAGISAVGNITAAYFAGDGSLLTNLPIQPGTYSNANVAYYLPTYAGNISANNILSSQYLYANSNSIFANTVLTGNVNLGNLYVVDQTIGGRNINGNITISPEGDGWVNTPKISIENSTIANTGGKLQFDTPTGVDIQFTPGNLGNILTAGNVVPTGNNLASLGSIDNRYTDIWLGSGNINLIDDTLNINQQISAVNGNIVMVNSTGLSFGNFRFYGNTMALANAAANLVVGTANATGWVQFNRSIAVQTTVGDTAFSVSKNGLTNIYTPGTIANTDAALNIVGSSSGNAQPRNFSGTMLQITGQDNQPTRISFDAFGANGAQNSYAAIAGRAARGTVNAPTALQANDVMTRITSQGWTGNGVYAPSIARMNFAAAEAFTSNASVGTYANIQLTPIGSNVIKTVTGFSGNGIVFDNASTGGTGNLGITFQDGTFQNTAFSPSNVVTSATAATGITVTPATTGDITITNTGVVTVAGTSNQIFVGPGNAISAANGIVQLSLPQDIAPTSSPTFNTLNVTNLNITGNVSNVIPAIVNGPIIYVANTATQLSDINNSGLITGNSANGFYAGMLYNTTSNTWDMSIGNSVGITADFVDAGNANIETQLHVGNAVTHLDYPYAVIQGDMDQNSYTQIVLQNHNQGANASADYVAVNNIGNDGSNYIDMGINSNVYNNTDYAVTKANDGYLYVNGGNLVVGTQTAGRVINFFTGGTNSTSYIRGTLSNSGLSMVGNVTANNLISNTVATTDGISAGGNIVGNNISVVNQLSVQGNILAQNVNTGIVSATGNIVSGNVRTGNISATGNVYAGYLVTPSTTINNGISTTGTITAQALTATTVSATGNVNGSNLVANLAVISGTLSILGNIQGGNLLTSGVLSTTGNIAAGNISTAGRVIVTGNVDAGNLRTSGNIVGTVITATGNIATGGFFVGDGGFISNIVATTGTKIVNGTSWANIATSGGNLVVAVGGSAIQTISTGGANVTGYANITGNVSAGNIAVVGNANTANLTVTGISNLNSNANVKITGGNPGETLITDGTGNLRWATPLGANTIIQSAANTTVNVDFTYESLHLVYLPTGPVTINLSNYASGHTARVLVRYGTAYTLNTGIANAQQSTDGTITIPTSGAGGHKITGQQTVQLVYTCFDNTAANCYVATTFL
jgi:hypothetical protein